jgi:branched-chain amino acid transport system permease protein
LAIALLTVFTAFVVYRSRLGRGLFAIHDDEAVAEGLGVPTFRFKMIAFGLSTFFAGLAGGLHAIQISYVTIEGVFTLTIPLFVILMSLLGGRRHWLGPTIGAVIIHTLNDAFSDTSLQFVNDLVVGGLLIVVILFIPEGLYDRLRRRLLPSLVLGGSVLLIQAVFVGGRLTEQAAVIMLAVIALLMIPERFYQRTIGQIVPTRRAALDSTKPMTEPASGE